MNFNRNLNTSLMTCLFMLLYTGLFAQSRANKNSPWQPNVTPLVAGWDGTYLGNTPCPDCDGIQTLIRLRTNNTYVIQTKFLGKGDQIIEKQGRFLWNKDGINIVMIPDGQIADSNFALMAKNKMSLLNKNGKKYTGAQGTNYNLLKDKGAITDKYFKLIDIGGKPVSIDPKQSKEPFFLLKAEGTRLVGHGSCNSLMGTYTLTPKDKIAFGQVATTMMACPSLDLEKQMILVFESTDHYVISEDILTLENALNTVLARFQIVYLK